MEEGGSDAEVTARGNAFDSVNVDAGAAECAGCVSNPQMESLMKRTAVRVLQSQMSGAWDEWRACAADIEHTRPEPRRSKPRAKHAESLNKTISA